MDIDPPCTDCGDTGFAHQTEKACTCEAGINLWDDSTECFQCDGEGYVYGCSWDWQCDTWDGDSCLCTRRCDVCNPAKLTPEQEAERNALREVLRTALTAKDDR